MTKVLERVLDDPSLDLQNPGSSRNTYNPSVPMVRSETETGESLEARGWASLVHTVVNNKGTLSQER